MKIKDINQIVSETLDLMKTKSFFAMSQINFINEDMVKSVYIGPVGSELIVSDDILIAPYHNLLGQIAEKSIGDEEEIKIPIIGSYNGQIIGWYPTKHVEIVQKNKFDRNGKDDISGNMYFMDKKPIFIPSFRKYDIQIQHENKSNKDVRIVIKTKDENNSTSSVKQETKKIDSEDFSPVNLNENQEQLISEIKKKTIKKLGLVGEDILDIAQGTLMRENPYIVRVVMGPAGTGKSTTMIKKLGMNLDNKYSMIQEDKQKWYMFTPNDLLKHYLKEAFAKEGVGAPDDNMYVWADFVFELGKDLKILKSLQSKEGYTFEKNNLLKDVSATNLINFYDTFNNWYDNYVIKNIRLIYGKGKSFSDKKINMFLDKFQFLEDKELTISKFNNSVKTILSQKETSEYFYNNNIKLSFEDILKEIDKEKNQEIYSVFKKMLEKLGIDVYKLVEDIQKTTDRNNDNKNIVYADIIKTVLRYYTGKNFKKEEINIFNNLPKILQEDNDYKKELIQLKETKDYCKEFMDFLKKFANNYVMGIVPSYKLFKKENSDFYNTKSECISQNELDMLILSIIEKSKLINYELKNFNNYLCSHIYVDEITDFSPIQIKIAFNLVKKKVFFATGDFNQRFTEFGIQNKEQLTWATQHPEIYELSRPYRQTRKLANLSQKLKNEKELAVSKEYDFDGVKPVVGYNKINLQQNAIWLKDRLLEIGERYDETPSIAIIVNDENDISPLAEELNKVFGDVNMKVDACYKGQFLGGKNNIRIFSVDYIKGLEFEAVFFVDIDKLAERKSGILRNFLYVGISRAAMFFGVTTSKSKMPQELKDIEEDFGKDWK